MKKYIASAVSLIVGLVALAAAGVLAVAMMIIGLVTLPWARMKLKRAAATAANANTATWKPGENGTVIEGEYDNITGKSPS